MSLCQCPNCGRMHRSFGFGEPPKAIAGKSLLQSPELLGTVSSLCDAVSRELFGPRNHIWDKRWDDLHENGLMFQSWSGSEPTEGKAHYRAQAQLAINIIKEKVYRRLNEHLCEMREGFDDSIVGFNEAWDIVRKVLS